MLVGGPLGLAAFLLVQGNAQIEAGTRVESRVGEVPMSAQRTQAMILATPALRLHLFSGPDSFQAEVATRVLWRPVPLPRERPLFLETFRAAYGARPTGRSELRMNVAVNYGEQDYTFLSQQFVNQPTLPLSTTVLLIDASADALWRSSKRTTLAFRIGAYHRRSLDDRPNSGQSSGASIHVLPTQTMVSAAPALQLGLSRRSTADISIPISTVSSSGSAGGQVERERTAVAVLQPQLHLSETLTRSQQLHLLAGFTYAHAVQGSLVDSASNSAPLAQIGLDSEIYKSRTSTLRSSVNAGTAWVLDPVLCRGVWRGVAQAGVTGEIGSRWSASLSFSFVTDISDRSDKNAAGATVGQRVDSTMASAASSVRYRWTDIFVAELGGRFTERAPRLSSPDFEWRGRELWAFLALFTATRVSLTTQRAAQGAAGM